MAMEIKALLVRLKEVPEYQSAAVYNIPLPATTLGIHLGDGIGEIFSSSSSYLIKKKKILSFITVKSK
jgi:hypothetical protein